MPDPPPEIASGPPSSPSAAPDSPKEPPAHQDPPASVEKPLAGGRGRQRAAIFGGRVVAQLDAGWTALQRGLKRIDPNDDPHAEPLKSLPLLVLVVALSVSVRTFYVYKFQPMNDLGHHLALTAVVADYDRAGSLYPALYERLDPFNANSLLYTVGGHLGRIVGVTTAVRACLCWYVVGVPLASVYALRVFGRSTWGAVIAVPLVYNSDFVGGFANLLFAAPMMVLVLPLTYRLLLRPTWRRTLGLAVIFVLLFLSHAHAFLWMGVLSFLMVLTAALLTLGKTDVSWPVRLRNVGKMSLFSLLTVLPALLLFARWFDRTFGGGRTKGTVLGATSGWDNHFGAQYLELDQLFAHMVPCLRLFTSQQGLEGVVALVIVVGLAVALSRMHKYTHPPVMELACVVTFVSFFLLPEGLTNHDVIASRQIGISMWFLPALIAPIPWTTSRLAHAIVVLGIMFVTRKQLTDWRENVARFDREEMAGYGWVMQAAPPRQRLHYVKLDWDSKYFAGRLLIHAEKRYMADGFGQVADTPAILSTSPIRLKPNVDVHRIGEHSQNWPSNDEIWKNFDLVLVHGWNPSDAALRTANERAVRLRKYGTWELWRKNGPWQTEPGADVTPREMRSQ